MRGGFLIIANPTSGRGRGRRIAEDVASLLRSQGRHVELEYTARSGDAAFRARSSLQEQADWACVVACGGDGTVQEVAGSLADHRASIGDNGPALGLAPAGRCNDFARALGITPESHAIVDVLTQGEPIAVDLGRVNGKYFCTVATVGIDAEVSDFVDSMRMPLRGTAAYIYGAICVLATYQAPKLRMEGDFGVMERELLLASSANTSSYGGAIQIAPHAVPTDGQLDVCLVDPMPRLRALRLLPKLMSGRHVTRPEVHFHQIRRMTIAAERELDIWADGERLARTPATIEVVPGAVRVLCSRRVLHAGRGHQ